MKSRTDNVEEPHSKADRRPFSSPGIPSRGMIPVSSTPPTIPIRMRRDGSD